MTVTTQPADATVLVGQTATFTVVLSDPNGATYQWYKNNSLITGANASSYTTPVTVLADNDALFKVVAAGPSGTATSSNALLAVVAPLTISNPIASFDFDDEATPDGTTLIGANNGGYIASGGVGGSGCLHLTDAINSEQGTFTIPDLNTNAPVKAITVHFSLLEGGGRFRRPMGLASSGAAPTTSRRALSPRKRAAATIWPSALMFMTTAMRPLPPLT